ncbi:MAG: tRNA (adenine-N1)-methyltransferase [Acidimicrobiia bacterium]
MSPTGSAFSAGESCLLYDVRGNQYLLKLSESGSFQFDKGSLSHAEIIGADEGSTLRSTKDSPLVAVRPRLADYVLKMKRGAAVMYPKDAGALVMWADISPGDRIIEAGTGSGALTLALSRAAGESGRVVSVERRDDHSRHAQKLVAGFRGYLPDNIEFRVGEVEDHVSDVQPDRVVLDVPEPWTVVDVAADHLSGGGTFSCYVPSVPQVQQVRQALDHTRTFMEVDTFEILMRSWNIDGRSVRPDHRMVGHTGFLTVARKRLREAPHEVDRSDESAAENGL